MPEIPKRLMVSSHRKKKAAIANLPSGIGVSKVSNGKTEFWRVRLGKRFTGGAVVTKHFSDLADARSWIFGGAQKEKAEPGSMLTLEQRFGAAAFALSPAQINEAAWAVQNLPNGTSLTDAVKFFNRHHRQADQTRRISEVAAEIVTAKTQGATEVTLRAWRGTGGGLLLIWAIPAFMKSPCESFESGSTITSNSPS